ncbi:MAG: hypothetical protein WCI78_00275 [Mycobacterium sp.]
MAAPQHSDVPYPDPEPARPEPRVIRLRVSPWDVVCTVVLMALLVYLATATPWPGKLYAFMHNLCEGDTCGAVPFGADYYIRPLVWGGAGAAIAASIVGPLVSLLKGWYMSFWPALSLALVVVSCIVGSLLTAFSQRYWM